MATLSAEDSRIVIDDFNLTDDATTLGRCLHELVELATASNPDKTAVICGDTEVTYGKLNGLANRFARVLVDWGIRQGGLIGVALDRSIDLVMVLLAVLKTGSAYLPIDPTYPPERIKYTLNDAAVKLVVVSATTQGAVASWDGMSLNIDKARNQMHSKADDTNLALDVLPKDLSYVIYTSGSTGQPKGVDIGHEAVCNMLLALQREPGCSETDRLLAVSTISFDMAVPELFLPLICGATIILAEAHQIRDAQALVRLIEYQRVTIMQGTPTIWQMLIDVGWSGEPRLMKMLSAGEPLSRQLAANLLNCGDEMWNLYGPTEAAVHATAWRVVQGEDIIVGRPIANYRLYVLGEDLLPVPLGSSGEVYIGGRGLARGYHNKPELTRSRFIPNSFHQGLMYRTGDLGRFLAPGRLRVLGRADDQIKLRGHRIEPAEVEAAITSHEYISRAVVVSRGGRMIAFCIRATTIVVSVSEVRLDRVLRPWLAARLPAYMMPAFFVELDAFPLTLNRKIDRKALPDPVVAKAVLNTDPDTDMELEDQIVAIWSSVLGHDRIGVHDNFFEIGGDSTRVIRVQIKIKQLLGLSVSPAKLFEYYTVKDLAAYLGGTRSNGVGKEHATPRLRRNHDAHDGDVAIISMACRLPGGVATPEDFWEVLDNDVDAIVDVPGDRWDDDANADTPYCRRGGFIPSIDSFDAPFFGISPREARELDPTHYLMLETCWEAFERAGYTTEKLNGSHTGVFIGVSSIPAYHHGYSRAGLDGYSITGTAGGTLSGRISYILGLEGPALTIDTACSSSLVTTHIACNALRQNECDMAISGGVCLMLTPGLHAEFSRLGGMSSDGRCRAFAADSQGTGWGEGAAAIVLKRLADAQRDGDTIHAVLRSTAVNHSGLSAGLTTPSGPAQQRLIRMALAAARLQPDDIDYVEAHGTGTRIGDPIEGGALAEVFGGGRSRSGADPGPGPLWVGSAKSNIGHTQAAAGLVGVLKVVLAMKHSRLPRTLYAQTPTPEVDWTGLALVQQQQPWLPRVGRRRRAGVSAFGIGGTNAHAVLEEPPTPTAPEARDDSLWAIAFSLATTRNHFRRRLVLMARDRAELLDKLAHVPASATQETRLSQAEPRVAMLFTGQGSQWPGMGRGLASQYPVFREALEEIAHELKDALDRPLLDVMWADPGSEAAELLQRTDYAQPALFALEVALWRLWDSWGVRPHLVLGHSVGELAAAHAAGIMSLSDACHLVAVRGRLMQFLPGHGGMVSLEASAEEAAAGIQALNLASKVDIAGYNTPAQTIISGDVNAIEILGAWFTAKGRKSKILKVSHAFHSHHIDDGMLEALRTTASKLHFRPARLPIVSSLRGRLAHNGELQTAEYWVQQARKPVRFSEGIQTLAGRGTNIFLELGPRPVLCGMGSACLDNLAQPDSISWLPSLVPGKDDAVTIQSSLARLHVRHVPIDWSGYFKPFSRRRVELPTYAFQRHRFNIDTQETRYNVDGVKDLGTATDRLDRFRFVINWQQIDTAASISGLGGSWGLLCPAGEVAWAEEVESTLLLRSGLRQLRRISGLSDAQQLDGVLCLWDSDAKDVPLAARKLTAAALSQVQEAARGLFALPIVWVTRNAVGTGAGADDVSSSGIAAAPLWGLMRTAQAENPNLKLRLIDLDEGPTGLAALAPAIMLPAEPQCAMRQGKVLVPRLQPFRPRAGLPSQGPLVRRDGAVLITGGTGGIGRYVARWLARAHGVRDLVLISRRGPEAPGAEALVAELAQLGAEAELVAGDVADVNSLRAILSRFGGSRPLRGVIHAAGVLDDGVLSALTPQRCDTAFAPKADGAWNLHQLTQGMDLDLFVLFSSVSGIMGAAGQGNYAAANTFLDALAYRRRAEKQPATSVAWGLWTGEGMAANMSASCLARYLRSGLDPLSPEDGLELLGQAARSGALTVAAAYNVQRLQECHNDGHELPPLLRSLIRTRHGRWQMRHGEGRGQSESRGLRATLDSAAPEEHPAITLVMVRLAVAQTLGFSSPDDVDVDVPLRDMGIDSLTAVLTRNQLAALTGLSLPAGIALQHPNLTTLSQFLLSQVQQFWADSSSEAETPAGPALGTPESGSASQDTPLFNDRVLSPVLGLVPPHSPADLFASALSHFSAIPWCSLLVHQVSPTSGLLPGHGQAIGFIPSSFNPPGAHRDQFIGSTLSGTPGSTKTPPLRHMLCLFRPSDASHLHDPARAIHRVATLFALGGGSSGFEGIVHGGLIATLLDESLGAINELNAALGKTCGNSPTTISVTESLSIRYLVPLATTEEAVCVTAWIEAMQGGKATINAELTNLHGTKLAVVESTWATIATPAVRAA
ncbi:hypothetical protein HIM_07865 [Hirsutella minnesotensis 3608]|uniref:Polyketide synthase n=1 Tax=Hirsutella minnesotensis 3608 TaxID=1043627 RepID=A0A0F7ZT85_9HYPO|nr:hypothetical protein HIM_07865 [Hirsutella minnesotensis 3608]